jgi:uncharacterized Ntn-hydrolase superfamily protein
MTYSIVARDPATGELGVAVQSHFFGVGSLVSWADAGVGAVATQSVIEPAYGPRGLELLREGASAPEALHRLLAEDPQEPYRQLAILDRWGRVAVHTGGRCIREAGQRVGNQMSAQANMMRHDSVWGAMEAAYRSAEGDLANRLLAALDAAEAEGGDVRGRQSAAIRVVAAKRLDSPHDDVVFDLRVEDDPDPLGELRRLVDTKRAYDHVDAGDELAAAGDSEAALERYEAAHRALPGNEELTFWNGVALASNGREDEARDLLAPVLAAGGGWVELLGRLPEAGLFPDDPELISRLLGRS